MCTYLFVQGVFGRCRFGLATLAFPHERFVDLAVHEEVDAAAAVAAGWSAGHVLVSVQQARELVN